MESLLSLLINLILCLTVLFMPVLLLYGSAFSYEHGYCKDASLLILLNVFLAVSIIILVIDKQVSTFAVMAVFGYGLVTVAIVGVMVGSLLSRTWSRIRVRSQLRMLELREEQNTLSQSFLPY